MIGPSPCRDGGVAEETGKVRPIWSRRATIFPVRPHRDGPLTWVVGFGPAIVWVAVVTIHLGPSRGYGVVLPIALISGLGVLGLSALVLAYLPAALERVGLKKLAALLRRVWDRDAR